MSLVIGLNMFTIKIFYYLLLIYYFKNYINYTECYLLSRAKNPLSLFGATPMKLLDEKVDDYDTVRTLEPDSLYQQAAYEPPKSLESKKFSKISSDIPNIYNESQNKETSYLLRPQENMNSIQKSLNGLSNVDDESYRRTIDNSNIINPYGTFRTFVIDSSGPDPIPGRPLENIQHYQFIDKNYQYEGIRPSLPPSQPLDFSETEITTQLSSINHYRPTPVSRYVSKPVLTSPPVDKYHRVDPTLTASWPENNYRFRQKTPSVTTRNKLSFGPIRSTQADDNLYYDKSRLAYEENNQWYRPMIGMSPPPNIYRYEPIKGYQTHRNVGQYERVITSPLPMRTLSEPAYHYGPVSPENIYRDQLAITFPQMKFRFKPVNYSTPRNIYRFKPTNTPQQHGYLNQYEQVLAAPPPENIYFYETIKTSPLQSDIPSFVPGISTVQEHIYHFEPLKPSESPDKIYRYKPIKFSALYIDQPSWRTRTTAQKPLSTNSLNKMIHDTGSPHYFVTPTRIHDESTITSLQENIRLSPAINPEEEMKWNKQFWNITDDANKLKHIKSPIILYTLQPTSSRIRDHFTPFLISTSNVTRKKTLSLKYLPFQNRKYTSALLKRISLGLYLPKLNNSKAIYDRHPSRTTTKKAMIIGRSSTKSIEDYWSEFMHMVPHRFTLPENITSAKSPPDGVMWRDFQSSISQDVFWRSVRTTTDYYKDVNRENWPEKDFGPVLWGITKIKDETTYHVGPMETLSKFITNMIPFKYLTSSSDERIHLSKHGYKTLWASKLTPRKEPTKTTFEPFVVPVITTKTKNWFYWNFNDEEWPRIELEVPSTRQTTVKTTSKIAFHNYFPYYMRASNEGLQITHVTKSVDAVLDAFLKEIATEDKLKEPEIFDVTTCNNTVNETKAIVIPPSPIYCYMCGLNISGIPYYPSCYHVFNSPNSLHVFKKKHYKVICKNRSRKRADWVPDNPRKIFRGGCFKRYVEFGEVYNERGCRTMEPVRGKSIVSSRLAKLEKLLADVDEGCVTSPYASLTPFSKTVSLYARYHACVCKGKYCNGTVKGNTSFLLMTIIMANIFLRI